MSMHWLGGPLKCPNFREPESFSLYVATRPGERRLHFFSFLVSFFPFFSFLDDDSGSGAFFTEKIQFFSQYLLTNINQ